MARAGFTGDDLVRALDTLSTIIGLGSIGFGGPHDRVWQWYSGTIDVNATSINGNPVFRRITDEGRATFAKDFLPTQLFNDMPWYPVAITDDSPDAKDGNRTILEGIQYGWYYSLVGGGGNARSGEGRTEERRVGKECVSRVKTR